MNDPYSAPVERSTEQFAFYYELLHVLPARVASRPLKADRTTKAQAELGSFEETIEELKRSTLLPRELGRKLRPPFFAVYVAPLAPRCAWQAAVQVALWVRTDRTKRELMASISIEISNRQ